MILEQEKMIIEQEKYGKVIRNSFFFAKTNYGIPGKTELLVLRSCISRFRVIFDICVKKCF